MYVNCANGCRWTKTHDSLLDVVFKQSFLAQIVSESKIYFRFFLDIFAMQSCAMLLLYHSLDDSKGTWPVRNTDQTIPKFLFVYIA